MVQSFVEKNVSISQAKGLQSTGSLRLSGAQKLQGNKLRLHKPKISTADPLSLCCIPETLGLLCLLYAFRFAVSIDQRSCCSINVSHERLHSLFRVEGKKRKANRRKIGCCHPLVAAGRVFPSVSLVLLLEVLLLKLLQYP